MTWAFLTGEYPPQFGGVSDYTRLVAAALARSGDRVHVWAPECAGTPSDTEGVTVHRLPGHYGSRALRQLDRDLHGVSSPRVFVQYVPHSFGWKAMNVPFCLWLRSRKEPVWTMFHEVAYPRRWKQSASEHVLGAVTHGMARLVAAASQQIFYSTSAWLPLLDRLAGATKKTWLPVPSNIAETADGAAVAGLHLRTPDDRQSQVIGHFGTYGALVRDNVTGTFSQLLADTRRVALFAGRGSNAFRTAFLRGQPSFASRVHAIETDCGKTLAAHLAACDVLVQPYPDGITTRRGSSMAGLALGKAIVSNLGALTESLWLQSGAVVLAPDPAPTSMAMAADRLLLNPAERAEIGSRARQLYQDRFALHHTLSRLQSS